MQVKQSNGKETIEMRWERKKEEVVGKRKEDSLGSHAHRNVKSDKDTRSLLTIHCNY